MGNVKSGTGGGTSTRSTARWAALADAQRPVRRAAPSEALMPSLRAATLNLAFGLAEGPQDPKSTPRSQKDRDSDRAVGRCFQLDPTACPTFLF